VRDTWLARYLHNPANITHSIADNAAKNTMAYHCVQHQKFAWIAAAEQEADVIIWIDYGILHVPGVTAAVIQKYLERAGDYGSAVTLPGCWPKQAAIDGRFPHWRFCGGLLAVPRPLVKTFTTAARGIAIRQIEATKNVEWEVNTLARLEQAQVVPMAWYQADHDHTMFSAAP